MPASISRLERPGAEPPILQKAGCELCVVIPTFNERHNVKPLIDRLERALFGVRWRAVFVDDDSPDRTWEEVRRLSADDPRIQCIRRVGRRGLAGAVMEGALSSSAELVAVIDADLQHDERLLIPMLVALRKCEADLVMACRQLGQPGETTGLNVFRRTLSRLANRTTAWVAQRELSDPLSGFFMMRQSEFDRLAPRLSPRGFKILFDILATSRGELQVLELPSAFAPRAAGHSKFDQRVVADYTALALSKISRDLFSPRAVMFGLVGLSGIVVHFAVMRATLGLGFTPAQFFGAATAMTSNYFLNNALTYRGRSRRGWRLLAGYLKFVALCGLGLAANVGAATLVRGLGAPWWASGAAGAVVGAAWNFLSTATAVWG
jgi:dolichol-phosphate mannosyltransferase